MAPAYNTHLIYTRLICSRKLFQTFVNNLAVSKIKTLTRLPCNYNTYQPILIYRNLRKKKKYIIFLQYLRGVAERPCSLFSIVKILFKKYLNIDIGTIDYGVIFASAQRSIVHYL